MAGQGDEGVLKRPSLCPLHQGRGRVLRDDLAVVDDGHLVGDALGLFHVMRGEKDGDLLLIAQAADEGPDVVAGLRIEANGRLIEEKDSRFVEQRAGNLEAPLHAAGIGFHEVVPAVPQLDEFEEGVHPLLALAGGHAVENAVNLHVFPAGQLAIETGVLENDAE